MKYDLMDPAFAYFYGFVLADGHFCKRINKTKPPSYSVSICQIEKKIYENFSKLCPNSKVFERYINGSFAPKAHKIYNWVSSDKELNKYLVKIGLPSGKKSFIVEAPKIPYSEVDFWRGVIDGDGWVSFQTRKNMPIIGLSTVSENLKNDYILFLKKHIPNLNINLKRKKKCPIFNIDLYGNNCKTIVDLLYYNDCIALKRKYEKALEIKERKMFDFNFWTKEEDEIISNNISAKECVNLLKNRTYSAIQSRRVLLKKYKEKGISK